MPPCPQPSSVPPSDESPHGPFYESATSSAASPAASLVAFPATPSVASPAAPAVAALQAAFISEDIFFVRIMSERFGPYWTEMDENGNRHAALLADLVSGQHEDAIEILRIRPDGTWGLAGREFARLWFDQLLHDGDFDEEDVPLLISTHLDWGPASERAERAARADIASRLSLVGRK